MGGSVPVCYLFSKVWSGDASHLSTIPELPTYCRARWASKQAFDMANMRLECQGRFASQVPIIIRCFHFTASITISVKSLKTFAVVVVNLGVTLILVSLHQVRIFVPNHGSIITSVYDTYGIIWDRCETVSDGRLAGLAFSFARYTQSGLPSRVSVRTLVHKAHGFPKTLQWVSVVMIQAPCGLTKTVAFAYAIMDIIAYNTIQVMYIGHYVVAQGLLEVKEGNVIVGVNRISRHWISDFPPAFYAMALLFVLVWNIPYVHLITGRGRNSVFEPKFSTILKEGVWESRRCKRRKAQHLQY